MSRENARMKGMRYLGEGRLTVLLINQNRVSAECKGGGVIYHPEWADGIWQCDCPARGVCSHLHALMAVVVREARP